MEENKINEIITETENNAETAAEVNEVQVVSEEKAEKKPTTKKNIKVDGGKKKSDSNKKSTKGTSDKKVEETAE